MTRPNPPENLACRLAEDIHGTRLSWDDPSEMAPNNTVKYYNSTLELCEKMYTKCKKCEYQSFSFIRRFTQDRFPIPTHKVIILTKNELKFPQTFSYLQMKINGQLQILLA